MLELLANAGKFSNCLQMRPKLATHFAEFSHSAVNGGRPSPMSDVWEDPNKFSPTYSEALRQFVRYHARTATIVRLRQLLAEQSRLETRWFIQREEMRRNGAPPDKLAAYDRRFHAQAQNFAQSLEKKLGEELKLPLFRPSASPTVQEDRAKFMRFLTDLVAR